MKKENQTWLLTFLAGFLATVLGIALTFGIESRINAHKRAQTAHLLALQIVDKMEQTYEQLHEYLDIYASIDSSFTCLRLAIQADTLERVDEKVAESFLVNSLSEYVQVEVDNGLDAYRAEMLHTLGDIALIGHIDQFYYLARQCVKVSQQVIDQKRVVSDIVYARFFGKGNAITNWDYVRFLHNLSEFDVLYSRMQAARYPLMEGEKLMQAELEACKKRLQLNL